MYFSWSPSACARSIKSEDLAIFVFCAGPGESALGLIGVRVTLIYRLFLTVTQIHFPGSFLMALGYEWGPALIDAKLSFE